MSSVTGDLEALWGLRSALSQTQATPGLPLPLLQELRRLLGADEVSFNALDSRNRRHDFCQGVTAAAEEADATEAPDPLDEAFWTHYWHSPQCSYPDRTGDLRSVTLNSDFHDRRGYRASPMYVDYLRHIGVEHELMMVLPHGRPGRSLRLLVSRSDGPDFTEHDRFLVELLRPHLSAAYARCRAAHDGTTLTPRQREVLALVRDGSTNRTIARQLGITEGTVRTHLQNAYDLLGVSSRTAASARAEELG